MSAPNVEIVDESVLRRPPYDVHYDRGLVSAYYQLRQGYHIIRRISCIPSRDAASFATRRTT
jgi:hypothetical protein